MPPLLPVQDASAGLRTFRADAGSPARLTAIDAVRGLAVALMALDHIREFFSNPAVDPMDLAATTPALFFTRWITHPCAPVFLFLAGAAAALGAAPAGMLVRRGAMLIVLEFTVIRCFGWYFNFDYSLLGSAGVMWAIGCSMIALAGLKRLPAAALAVISGAVIAGHHLLDRVQAPAGAWWRPLWLILHEPGDLRLGGGPQVEILYPLVPWFAVMSLGYSAAAWFRLPGPAMMRRFGLAGLVSMGAFALLRRLNGYGDPVAWKAGDSLTASVLSFLRLEKYPPSLDYLLANLGLACVLLAAAQGARRWAPRVLVRLGRTPLFFYLLHLPLIHSVAVGYALVQGFPAAWLFRNDLQPPAGYGAPLSLIYGVWICVLALLLPACEAYADWKARQRAAWVKYF